jgi:hypothetical protein
MSVASELAHLQSHRDRRGRPIGEWLPSVSRGGADTLQPSTPRACDACALTFFTATLTHFGWIWWRYPPAASSRHLDLHLAFARNKWRATGFPRLDPELIFRLRTSAHAADGTHGVSLPAHGHHLASAGVAQPASVRKCDQVPSCELVGGHFPQIDQDGPRLDARSMQ